jgi:Flp pilus assembly pilin Flp
MMRSVRNARGLTLVEFTMVAALGAVVMLTLTSFYLSAQSMWIDSSVQAVSQRDATMFVGEIGRRVEGSDHVVVGVNQLELYRGPSQTGLISWTPDHDHAEITDFDGGGSGTTTEWPANGKITTLQFSAEGTDPRVVQLDSLRIETPTGETLYLSSAFCLYNHP